MLFLPPILASLMAYLGVRRVNGVEEKIALFWLLWASIAVTIHVLLGLYPLIALAYPLLALFTGYFMISRVKVIGASKGPNRGDKE